MPRTQRESVVRPSAVAAKKPRVSDRELLRALATYDPGDAALFARLLRKSMDRIEGHEKLARLMGKSIATLHRWADPKTPVGGVNAASPLERAAMVSLLRVVVVHGVDVVEARLPSVLASIVNGVDLKLGRAKRTGAKIAKSRLAAKTNATTHRTATTKPMRPVRKTKARKPPPRARSI